MLHRWIECEFFVLFRRIKFRCFNSLSFIYAAMCGLLSVIAKNNRSLWEENYLVNGSGRSIELLGKISDCFFLGLPGRFGRSSCSIGRLPCCRWWRNKVRFKPFYSSSPHYINGTKDELLDVVDVKPFSLPSTK